MNRAPVIGANIKEKETGNGTITDINGNFSLSVGTKSTIIIHISDISLKKFGR